MCHLLKKPFHDHMSKGSPSFLLRTIIVFLVSFFLFFLLLWSYLQSEFSFQLVLVEYLSPPSRIQSP